jgi:hypothetical protein
MNFEVSSMSLIPHIYIESVHNLSLKEFIS